MIDVTIKKAINGFILEVKTSNQYIEAFSEVFILEDIEVREGDDAEKFAKEYVKKRNECLEKVFDKIRNVMELE